MKMSDRIKRNMQPAELMTLISLRLPEEKAIQEAAEEMRSGR